MKASRSYHDYLIKSLKDPREAAGYLNAALEDYEREAFLLALRNVAEAHGGLLSLARRTGLHRVNLYRILSKKGNPEIRSLEQILKAFGLRLAVIPHKISKAA
jgi:probable addiction module antidote protein